MAVVFPTATVVAFFKKRGLNRKAEPPVRPPEPCHPYRATKKVVLLKIDVFLASHRRAFHQVLRRSRVYSSLETLAIVPIALISMVNRNSALPKRAILLSYATVDVPTAVGSSIGSAGRAFPPESCRSLRR